MALLEFDAYSPPQIADRVSQVGVAKARLPWLALFMLGILAGAFIGLGALYYTVVVSDPGLSFGLRRVLGGVVFSLGLVLVVIGGAELFTGNNLLVMAWADGKISTRELLRNWLIVYCANAIGALGLAALVFLSDHGQLNQGAIASTYVSIAANKTSLAFLPAFFSGVLCNLLVCLAVWIALAGHSVVDKLLAVVFPISAFVAAGFEHSVANMYFIPLGILFAQQAGVAVGPSWSGLLSNLLPVTLGNMVGGSILVAVIYHLIYRHALRQVYDSSKPSRQAPKASAGGFDKPL